MLTRQVKFSSVIVLCLMLFGASSSALPTIAADDGHYQYSGRIDLSQQGKAYLSWPGSSIKMRFSGAKFTLVMADDKGQNFYNIIFNGQDTYPLVLATEKGRHSYDLSYMLEGSPTTVEIFKRTEGTEGGSYFYGVQLEHSRALLPPPPVPKRKIAFFGDSVTSGMGNEAPYNSDDNLSSQKNHYLSYAPVTARMLDAEFHTVSQSGIGFMISWFDFIMADFYDQMTATGNNASRWDFTLWQPDVVVVNLGQNDSWLIDNEQRLKPHPQPAQIIQAYVNFIDSLRDVYPHAQFLCVLGSMDITANNRWPDYLTRAIAHIEADDPTVKIDSLLLPYSGYEQHPRVAQHQKNAQLLAAKIRQLMSW
jgi:lysophospholipase L1-like esterase